MAKSKKTTKDEPPKVTDEESREDLPDLARAQADLDAASETQPDIPADLEPENVDHQQETLTDPAPGDDVITLEEDQFVEREVSDDPSAETEAGPLGQDTLEDPSGPVDDSLAAETVEETVEMIVEAEEAPDRESEPEAQASPPPAPVPPQRGSSFWPAVFGGVIAALLGFIAGRGDMLDAYLPRANAPEPVDLGPLNTELAALSDRLATLESAEPPEMPELPDIPDVSGELGGLSQSLASIETSLQGLTERLDAVEARPVAEPPEPVEDNSEELAALQSSIEDLEARLAEEDARASAEAARLLAQAALTRVVTAVETGEPFEPALGALEEVAPVEVPDALRNAALEGVPTLTALRESFPDAARAALAAARSEVPESDVQGIGGFLRRQLSARSVTPREGSDPDAVLSRAEAALRASDLDAALAETEALPDASKAAMEDWLAGAEARKSAGDAAKALSDSLTVN